MARNEACATKKTATKARSRQEKRVRNKKLPRTSELGRESHFGQTVFHIAPQPLNSPSRALSLSRKDRRKRLSRMDFETII